MLVSYADYVAAWVLNLGGLAGGLFTSPRRVFAAFVRGRRSRTLYGEPFEPLLDGTVGDLRAQYIEVGGRRAATSSDGMLFAVACLAGIAVGLTMFAIVVPLVPVGLLMSWRRRRERSARGTLPE